MSSKVAFFVAASRLRRDIGDLDLSPSRKLHMTRPLDQTLPTDDASPAPSRRRFLGAALAGTAAVALPVVTAGPARAATHITAEDAYSAYWTARYRYAGKVPYVYGGMDPDTGFDCSGMTKWLYSRFGVYLPRSADEQYRYVRAIDKGSARPGDLVFYVNSSGRAFHNGLYAGGDMLVDAGNPEVDISYRRIYYGSKVVFGTQRY